MYGRVSLRPVPTRCCFDKDLLHTSGETYAGGPFQKVQMVRLMIRTYLSMIRAMLPGDIGWARRELRYKKAFLSQANSNHGKDPCNFLDGSQHYRRWKRYATRSPFPLILR